MTRRPLPRPPATAAGALLSLVSLLVAPLSADAQLRPYEPFRWDLYDGASTMLFEAGASILWDQRASLAGTRGRLLEAGEFAALFRTGRVTLEAAGTVRRSFEEEDRFAAPVSDVSPATESRRVDSGDYRVITTVLLTPVEDRLAAALRFGTRLPTTDNRVGLERDMTDFFALLIGRAEAGSVRGTAELGVGIHGTRMASYEQSDVLVYSVGLELLDRRVRPSLSVTGHADGLADRSIRGNEELSEIRVGLRSTGRYWISAEALRGLTEFSPDFGLSLSVGVTR